MNQLNGGPSPSPAGGFPPWLCRAAAGLDTGLLGAAALLAWLIAASLAGGLLWFSRLNLAAGPFFGDRVFSSGAGWHTLTGSALLLLIYSLLGAAYAFLPASREGWLNLLTALGYAGLVHICADAWLWKWLHPFAHHYFAPLAIAPAHLLYGFALWRYPARLRSLALSLGDPSSIAQLAPEPPDPAPESALASGSPAGERDAHSASQAPDSPHESPPDDGGPPPSSLE
jgi:hypothetical protein